MLQVSREEIMEIVTPEIAQRAIGVYSASLDACDRGDVSEEVQAKFEDVLAGLRQRWDAEHASIEIRALDLAYALWPDEDKLADYLSAEPAAD